MTLTDQSGITGLQNDHVSRIVLNDLQRSEINRYFRRISDGTYTLHRHTACPICSCDHGTIVAKKDRYGIPQTTVVCHDCGVIFAHDPLDAASLAKFYQEQYRLIYDGHKADSVHKERYHEQRFAERTSLAGMFLGQVSKVAPLPETGTVVEIGSGGGWNIVGFPAKGWTAIGYDYDTDEMEHGKRRGLDMRYGSIEKAVSDGVKADLILMIQFLEHAADPVGTLRNAAKLLNPDGVIYIGVPGFKSMVLGAWGDKLAGTLQNAHLFLFELRTLDIAASKSGLKRLWGNEGCTALYRLDSLHRSTSASRTKPHGRKSLRFVSLLERTSIFWEFVWKICGSPVSKNAHFIRRATNALARRLGFNI